MTEHEWLASTDPQPMLVFLQGKVSERKLRLFAVACCRRVGHLLADEQSRRTLEIIDRCAEGGDSRHLLREAHTLAKAACQTYADGATHDVAIYLALEAVCFAAAEAGDFAFSCSDDAQHAVYREAVTESADARGVGDAEYEQQCNLLRDIFGDPFRLAAPISGWLTPKVVGLAQTIHEDRAFDHMPILADALEEAGCTNADILNHCRQPGEHVRGCWVVDLLLGKE